MVQCILQSEHQTRVSAKYNPTECAQASHRHGFDPPSLPMRYARSDPSPHGPIEVSEPAILLTQLPDTKLDRPPPFVILLVLVANC